MQLDNRMRAGSHYVQFIAYCEKKGIQLDDPRTSMIRDGQVEAGEKRDQWDCQGLSTWHIGGQTGFYAQSKSEVVIPANDAIIKAAT